MFWQKTAKVHCRSLLFHNKRQGIHQDQDVKLQLQNKKYVPESVSENSEENTTEDENSCKGEVERSIKQEEDGRRGGGRGGGKGEESLGDDIEAVSYTHLTLPTIYSV